jgi:hypothetical protein
MEDIYNDNPGISKTELYRRALQRAQQNNQRAPTRNQIEAFYNRNQQQNTFTREYLKYKPMTIIDKNMTWQADLMIPFKRSADVKILILREIVSRYTIARWVLKKNLGDIDRSPASGDFGQVELDENDAKLIVPTFEDIIKDNKNKINIIIGDAEFGSNALKKLFEKYNIRYKFIVSLLAHQFKSHNALGIIDSSIKTLRSVIKRYMTQKDLTEDEFVRNRSNLQKCIDIMNNSVNRGIEVPNTTPKEVFENAELYTQVKNLRQNKQNEIKAEWNELDKTDLDKPYLVADIRSTRDDNRRWLKTPYFLHKLKDNKYVTKVNNVDYTVYRGDIKELRGYILNDVGLPLRVLKPFEIKQYTGEYDEDEILDQEPLVMNIRRGRPVGKGKTPYLKSFIRNNYPEIISEIPNFEKGTMGGDRLKKWLIDNDYKNIVDEFEKQK